MASKPSPTKRTEKPTYPPPPSPTDITVSEDSLESSIESSDEDNSPPPNVAEKTEGFLKRMVAHVSRQPKVQLQKDFSPLVVKLKTSQSILQPLVRRKLPSTIHQATCPSSSEESVSNTQYFADDAATNKVIPTQEYFLARSSSITEKRPKRLPASKDINLGRQKPPIAKKPSLDNTSRPSVVTKSYDSSQRYPRKTPPKPPVRDSSLPVKDSGPPSTGNFSSKKVAITPSFAAAFTSHKPATESHLKTDPERKEKYKIILLGNAEVGKSTLIKSLQCDCGLQKLCIRCNSNVTASITNYEVPGICQLYIVDTPKTAAQDSPLVKQYLRHLDCAIFVFALDDPLSFDGLGQWVDTFEKELGSTKQVKKFMVGTKMDAGLKVSKEDYDKALSFAKEINAEFREVTTNNSGNVRELFAEVGDTLTRQKPSFKEPMAAYGHKRSSRELNQTTMKLHDALTPPGALMRYPDPVAFDFRGDGAITYITLTRGNLVMSGEDGDFTWGERSDKSFQEPLANTATLSVCPTSPPDSWQHEAILRDCVLGMRTNRQPTRTDFREVKKLLFSSGKKDDSNREKGLFFMLMLTIDDKLLELGLNPAQKIAEEDNVTEIRKAFLSSSQPPGLPNNTTATSISMSNTHAAVAFCDGSVRILGDRVPVYKPLLPSGIEITEVACGTDFTLLLTRSANVFSYGCGEYGQLGHGDENYKSIPTMVEGLSGVQAIAAGNHHSMAIAKSVPYGWGIRYDNSTQKESVMKPTKYETERKISVTSVACGSHHILCIAHKMWGQEPYSAGSGTHGQLGHGNVDSLDRLQCIKMSMHKDAVARISAGGNHSALLTRKGSIFTFGCNQFGQLGYFTEKDHSTTPQKVDLGRNADDKEISAIEVSCSEDCTMVLTTQNEVLMWGKGFYGTTIELSLPAEVEASTVVDVATARVCFGGKMTELAFGLTESHSMLLVHVGRSSSDFQTIKTNVSSNVDDLKSISSVGSVLVAVDKTGTTFFADSQIWCRDILSPEDPSLPDDLANALVSDIRMRESSEIRMPQLTWEVLPLSNEVAKDETDKAAKVETTFDTFFIHTTIGDVYSWTPLSGGKIGRHTELDNRIITEIACGLQHAAVLTDNGEILTCGTGSAGQLGHGTFENVCRFQPVPLMDSSKYRRISCGPASTAVVTESGKVFFWGRLEVLEQEKTELVWNLMEMMNTEANSRLFPISASREHHSAQRPAYHLLLPDKHYDRQVAIVGRPFEFEVKPTTDHVDNRTFQEGFRVDAYSIGDLSRTHIKGKVKQDDMGKLTGSIQFLEEAKVEVITTVNGAPVDGSPFRLDVEQVIQKSRYKLAFIGQVPTTMKEALQKKLEDNGKERDIFQDLHVELWGFPSTNTPQLIRDTTNIASLTNKGIYVYIWDSKTSLNLPDENIKFWLYNLREKARDATVFLLCLNISNSHLDVEPYKNINPNFKRAVFVGSKWELEPSILVGEIKSIVHEVHQNLEVQEMVWCKAEELAKETKKLKDGKKSKSTLSKQELTTIARRCGILSQYHIKQATKYLEETGIGLIVAQEEADLRGIILNEMWLTHQLTDISNSCLHGSLNSGNLVAEERKWTTELLQRRKLAIADHHQAKIHVVPFLVPLLDTIWSPSDSTTFTASRHLVLETQSLVLHTAFPNIIHQATQKYRHVSVGKNSLVVHGETYKCRVDCGRGCVEKTKLEVRVVVRADSPEGCGTEADSIVAFLRTVDGLTQSYDWSIKYSCSKCQLPYIEQSDVMSAETQAGSEIKCQHCKANVLVDDILNGHKHDGVLTDLNPSQENPGSNEVVLSSLHDLKDVILNQNEQLLSKIKEEFSKITRQIRDIDQCTTPRTVCILPNKPFANLGPKWRLYLLCEGNGDGTGIHFLDYKDHKGYKISKINEFVQHTAKIILSVLTVILAIFRPEVAAVIGALVPSVDTMIAVLAGGVALSAAVLYKKDWKEYFYHVKKIVEKFEESEQLSSERKYRDGAETSEGTQLEPYTRAYNSLKSVLSAREKEDHYGGLNKEPKGDGFVWVCEKHSKETNLVSTTKS